MRWNCCRLGDIPIGVWRSDGLYFIHVDHLNTPRAILDQANRVVWLWKSEPFGSQKLPRATYSAPMMC